MKKLIIKQVANGYIVTVEGHLDELVGMSVEDGETCDTHVFNHLTALSTNLDQPQIPLPNVAGFMKRFFETNEKDNTNPNA